MAFPEVLAKVLLSWLVWQAGPIEREATSPFAGVLETGKSTELTSASLHADGVVISIMRRLLVASDVQRWPEVCVGSVSPETVQALEQPVGSMDAEHAFTLFRKGIEFEGSWLSKDATSVAAQSVLHSCHGHSSEVLLVHESPAGRFIVLDSGRVQLTSAVETVAELHPIEIGMLRAAVVGLGACADAPCIHGNPHDSTPDFLRVPGHFVAASNRAGPTIESRWLRAVSCAVAARVSPSTQTPCSSWSEEE